MLFGFFLVCTIALGLATVLLALAGQRLRAASRISGVLLAAVVYFSAGWIVSEVWGISAGPIDAAEVFCFGVSLVVIVLRPVWNAIGQVFMGTVAAAALAYLIFAGSITVDGNLSEAVSEVTPASSGTGSTARSVLAFTMRRWTPRSH